MSRLLFHWSPTGRRKQIDRYGLRPGMLSTDRLWKPPYFCLSDSPSLAWALSGGTTRGHDIPWWDLWQLWSDRLEGYEEIYDDGRVKECRVYHRVFKRDIWYVGSRSADS